MAKPGNGHLAEEGGAGLFRYVTWWELAVLVLSLIFFYEIIHLDITTDIQKHAVYWDRVMQGQKLPPANFLYFITIHVFAFFNHSLTPLFHSSVVVLALAVAAKFLLARRFAADYLGDTAGTEERKAPSGTVIALLCIFSILAFSLPTFDLPSGRYYLGQIPPNVWHNSTTIFLMPFAFALFWLSYLQIKNPGENRTFAITILAVLNILVKPSFFFVFCLVYPVLLLRSYRFGKKFWVNLTPVVAGSILLAVEYYLIYSLGFSRAWGGETKIAFSPFAVWSLYSPNIPVSLLASVLFPLTFLCFSWRDVLHNLLLQYAVAAFLVAVFIFSALTEIGKVQSDGNFFWQCVVCNYLLFFVVSLSFYDRIRSHGLADWRNKILSVTYALHIGSGLVYFVKLFGSGTFV